MAGWRLLLTVIAVTVWRTGELNGGNALRDLGLTVSTPPDGDRHGRKADILDVTATAEPKQHSSPSRETWGPAGSASHARVDGCAKGGRLGYRGGTTDKDATDRDACDLGPLLDANYRELFTDEVWLYDGAGQRWHYDDTLMGPSRAGVEVLHTMDGSSQRRQTKTRPSTMTTRLKTQDRDNHLIHGNDCATI